MKIFQKTQVIGALLLFGAAGCADLQVDNPNAPDAGRALETAGDIESLIAGSYKNWYIANGAYAGISMALGNMAFEYGSSAANSGSV
jgi:high-affinity K+ transport system ATPase subunit B